MRPLSIGLMILGAVGAAAGCAAGVIEAGDAAKTATEKYWESRDIAAVVPRSKMMAEDDDDYKSRYEEDDI